MKQDFTEQFEIIWNKFIPNKKERKSLPAFARFLGHDHKGKVTAWSTGQWPSGPDCWVLHKKMGFALEWLLTGEGAMFTDEGGGLKKPPTPHIDAELLHEIIETLEVVLEMTEQEMPPASKATFVSQLYEECVENEEARKPAQMMRLIRNALAKAANE